jgi:hypothetical protein
MLDKSYLGSSIANSSYLGREKFISDCAVHSIALLNLVEMKRLNSNSAAKIANNQ